jgi:hypothetical protein
MKLTISETADPNYLATVVKCPTIKDHPNADKLSLIDIFGNEIIIQKGTYQEGELLVYFPVECCIDKKFLSWANLLDRPELNSDGKTKGFFGKQCRVKAIRLREVPSQGFVFKVSKLAEYYKVNESVFALGKEFDTVGSDLLVTKYVRPEVKVSNQTQSTPNKCRKVFGKIVGIFPRPVRKVLNSAYNVVESAIRKPSAEKSIVGNQFAFHYKTEQLGKNMFLISPDDIITVSEKLHGTSAIFAELECKKRFNPFRFLVGIPNTEYRHVYASRSRILTGNDNGVWSVISERIKDSIPDDYLIYGEIVGWVSPEKCVQKGYDYGLTKGELGFYVYRVVRNISSTEKHEFSLPSMVEFCVDRGLETVPIHYYGLAKDLFNIPVDDDWRTNFITKLKETYFKKQCFLSKNAVVNEGIVVRIESKPTRPAFKFKNPDFVIKESASRDNGESDMEEES